MYEGQPISGRIRSCDCSYSESKKNMVRGFPEKVTDSGRGAVPAFQI